MGSYKTTWSNATELGNIVSTLDKANVDFSDGAGQDANGKHLTSGKDIKMNVKISNWNENIAMAKSHGAYKPTPRPNSADSVNSPSDHRENPLSN